jgi:hypothetical protein
MRELMVTDSRFGTPYHDGYGINCQSFRLDDPDGLPPNYVLLRRPLWA